MTALRVRRPDASDAIAITAIDRAGLATGHASFRVHPYEWEAFTASYLGDRGFALVAERNGQVLGWAGVATVSDRCVYAGVGEVSIYVSLAAQRQGIGKALLRELLQCSEERGYWTLIAQIFPENTQSLALHRACQFVVVGRRDRIGRMSYGPMTGTWRDTIMLERRSRVAGID